MSTTPSTQWKTAVLGTATLGNPLSFQYAKSGSYDCALRTCTSPSSPSSEDDETLARGPMTHSPSLPPIVVVTGSPWHEVFV